MPLSTFDLGRVSLSTSPRPTFHLGALTCNTEYHESEHLLCASQVSVPFPSKP